VTVTQVHQGLGGWTLNLRSSGAADDFLARVNPWDHVLVTPRGLGPEPSFASVKAAALFAGRLDQVKVDGGSVEMSGPSIAVWLGDEAGNGSFPNVASGLLTSVIYSGLGWMGVIYGAAGLNLNGLYVGAWQNLQRTQIAWEHQRFKTARQNTQELAELMDVPWEWRVLPTGEIQFEGWAPAGRSGIGSAAGADTAIDYTTTLFSYLPRVMLSADLGRLEGQSAWTTPTEASLPLQVFPSEVAVNWDFSGFAARGVAQGSTGTVRSTGTSKDTYGTNGYSYDPTVRTSWDTLVDFDTSDVGLLQVAANSVGRLATIRREWTVETLNSDVVGFVAPGDYVWVHSDALVGIGAMTYAQEQEEWAGIDAATNPAISRFPQAVNVGVGGQPVYPARARVQSMDWPVSDKYDVWWAKTWDGTGDVDLLSPYVDWDPEGPVRIDCNGAPPRWQMQRKQFGITLARGVNLNANTRSR
jgi:hypothetical protein